MRPHFRAELERKLERHGHPPDEVGAAIARLTALGYLDEGATAREFVAARRRRGPEGRRRLAAELARRGAAPAAVEQALGEAGEAGGDEFELARRAAELWTARRPPRGERERAALGRHLERRGFGGATIWRVLRNLGADDADPGS